MKPLQPCYIVIRTYIYIYIYMIYIYQHIYMIYIYIYISTGPKDRESKFKKSKDRNQTRENKNVLPVRIIHVGVMCTLIGRVWGSRLRLRCVVVSLVRRRSRWLYHGLLLVYRRGRGVLSWRHPFVYGIQTFRLGERGNFVVRRETLQSCQQ